MAREKDDLQGIPGASTFPINLLIQSYTHEP